MQLTGYWPKPPAGVMLCSGRRHSWRGIWPRPPRLIIALLLLSAMALLSGCESTAPVPPAMEPVPRIWTDPMPPPSLDGSYGDYIAQCEVIVQRCNIDRDLLRRWSDEGLK